MDDLISREVAAKILRARAKMSVGTPKSVFYAAAGMIDKLPSVDAELVITGETSDGYALRRRDGGVCLCQAAGQAHIHAGAARDRRDGEMGEEKEGGFRCLN